MRGRLLLLLPGLVGACVAHAPPVSAPSRGEVQAQSLRALYQHEWSWRLSQDPALATDVGDSRFNDRLEDRSREAIEARKAHWRALQQTLASVPSAALSAPERLNLTLFRRDVDEEVEGQRFPSELLVLDQFAGPQESLTELAEEQPRATRKDFEDYLTRLSGVPRYIDQTIALLREGISRGVVAPRPVLAYVGPALQKHVDPDVTQTPLYALVFQELPSFFTASEAQALRMRAQVLIANQVTPAFQRLLQFYQSEYLPHAREQVGWSALPDGAAWYAYLVRLHTTTTRSPEEIHQLGLKEVERIRGEMERVKAQTGFKGSLSDFFAFLRDDPRFYFHDSQALLAAYRDIAKRIDPQLVTQFGHLPRLPYGVAKVPEHSADGMPAAYYMRGSLRAGRPGLFYANTSHLETRPRWEMESLTLHEAVPGHHLQLALAQEQESLPLFRRYSGYTAFIEGWGLYSEGLGADLGLYQDPYQRFGRLSNEMWRAVRLVVDTGLHAKGWSREQAIRFFSDHAGRSEQDITVEIDRYLAWGGQALAYKMGELRLLSLRHRAQEKLGGCFDVRAFHDFVLGEGGLPLEVLSSRVDDWMADQARAKPSCTSAASP